MKKVLITMAIAAAFSACTGNKNTKNDEASKNEALMREFSDEVMNKHNVAMIDSFVAPDYVEHCADPGYNPDRSGLKKSWEDFFKAYPDMREKINFMIADSNYVTVQFTMTGTNTGAVAGIPATGKKVSVDGVDIVRYKDGKAVEHWGYMDEMKMMQQLGMMPAMGTNDSAKADSSKKM